MAPPPSLPSSMQMMAAQPPMPQTARPWTSGSNNSTQLANTRNMQVSDFSSDVGRKKFGFSHEELDDSTAYYEGQFKLYQRCGDGTLHNPETGSKYVGQFQGDVFHGAGDLTWSDQSRYKGQWKNGQKHGSGEYVNAEELRYQGQWENGRRHGQGQQEYANSDRYEGWWFHGLCSGLGTYYFADQSRYEGAWANGRYDGAGVYYGSDGSREKQLYSSGLLIKREVLPPTANTKATSRRGMTGGKVLFGQTRDDMHRPAILPKPQKSKYLIRRETAGMDLSAPPIRPMKPKTAPAALKREPEGSLPTDTPRQTTSAPQAARAASPALPPVNATQAQELGLGPDLESYPV